MTHDVFRRARAWLLLGFTLGAALPARAADPATVQPNDNRHAAGRLADGTLTLTLRAGRGVWTPEGPDGPGVTIDALGVTEGPLQVPAPLVRVPEGTVIDATIVNTLDVPLTVHGWCTRGAAACAPLTVAPGASGRARFASGPAGVSHYWATSLGAPVPFREMAGAFVVDPAGLAPAPDRVLVITEWSGLSADDLREVMTADVPTETFIRKQPPVAFMVNGLSWPATERLAARVGVPERWHVVNLSSQPHPMHLHGFYFDVERRGDGRRDRELDAPVPRVVTELVPPAATMTMAWTPERGGDWLFHCHVMEHVSPLRRLPRASGGSSPAGHDAHHDASLGMAGLVLGVTVAGAPAAPPADPAPGPVRRLTLSMWGGGLHHEPATSAGFVLTENAAPVLAAPSSPGPPIVLTRGQPVEITLENHLHEGTSIHWHGMELESFYDGVHGWSGAAGARAPMVEPGGTFAVRFTPPRAGTFIYHTHLHDHRQLSSGLYGALVVVEPGTTLDPAVDHPLVLGRSGIPDGRLRVHDERTPVVLNGERAPRFVWRAGTTHRLRFINITPDDPLVVALRDPRGPVTWRVVAKDGASRQAGAAVSARQPLAVGETVDVEIDTPSGRGTLWLEVTTMAGEWQLQSRIVVK